MMIVKSSSLTVSEINKSPLNWLIFKSSFEEKVKLLTRSTLMTCIISASSKFWKIALLVNMFLLTSFNVIESADPLLSDTSEISKMFSEYELMINCAKLPTSFFNSTIIICTYFYLLL